MISCARKTTSTACSNCSTSNSPSSRRNLSRFREARLQAESSIDMYSLHGFDALMRPVFGSVCHLLIVVSYCTPGSAERHAASAIWRRSSFACLASTTAPSVRAVRFHSASFAAASMKASVTRTELFAFWYWIEAQSRVERHVVAGLLEDAGLLLFLGLAPDELLDVWVVDVEDDHLRRAPRLAAGLDRAGAGVGAAHEADRAGGVAALGELLLRRAQFREVDARAGAAAEDDPLAPDPVEDRLHRVVDREDEARAALRLLLEADVEPDRRVEGDVLVDQERLQLGLEGLRLRLVGEVAALAPPGADRVDDTADHLLDALLALGRGHAAAEVLLRDDVRGGLRPELRELDAVLH